MEEAPRGGAHGPPRVSPQPARTSPLEPPLSTSYARRTSMNSSSLPPLSGWARREARWNAARTSSALATPRMRSTRRADATSIVDAGWSPHARRGAHIKSATAARTAAAVDTRARIVECDPGRTPRGTTKASS